MIAERRRSFFKRQFIVDSKTQSAVLLYAFFMSISAVTITFSALIIMRALIQRGEETGAGVSGAYLFLTVFGTISFVLLAFLGVLISHRIAGPIYRLRKHMRELANGANVSKLEFRKDDHFKELASDYNAVLERLSKAEGKSL